MIRFTVFSRAFLVFPFFLLNFSLTFAASTEDQWKEWKEVKNFYDSQRYEEALQTLLTHPREDPNYYYNLGTLYFRLDRTGMALAYLEKANHQRPHDPDIQYNLSIAKSQLQGRIGRDRIDPASTWAEKIADRVSLEEVRATLGLLGLIVIFLWIRAYLSTRSLRKALFQPAGFIGIIAFAITCGVYGLQRSSHAYPPAMSLIKQAVRSGPGEHYLELSEVESGTKLRLLGPAIRSKRSESSDSEPSEMWRQVRFSQEGIGWIREATLLIL